VAQAANREAIGRWVVLGGIVAILVYGVTKQHLISSDSLLLMAVLVPSVILHEVSHGVVALWFGDDTAKRAGRLTLNPIPHIDPFGSLLLPALLLFAGATPFGYAKPVPVNTRQLRHPRNQSPLVSLAGPATNIILAVLAAMVFRFGNLHLVPGHVGWVDVVIDFGIINVVLATFNLIPLPPLDGSAVVERFLPKKWWEPYLRLRQYSMLILFGIVFILRGRGLNQLFDRAIRLWIHLL
jgi:Zn-dependent protease